MKKFTKILALTLVVIMSVMVLASCAVPAKDPEKAKEALEDNDYEVRLIDDKKLLDDGVEAQLTAYNDDEEYIIIVWYKDAKDAKEAYDDLKEELADAKDDLKDEKDDMDEDDYKEAKEKLDKMVVGKSGKMFWYASSKAAVRAAK